ncbi:unnamed protein product [marine sediment metagenome]|uniref:Uncharacterized protein n=1 Tax=marine sediment metagenome TaxID=412755 RepID=X1UIZ0_9ZZZZ
MSTVYILGAGASAAAAMDNQQVMGDDFLQRAFQRGKGIRRLESVEKFVKKFFRYQDSDQSVLPALEEVLSVVDIALERGEALSSEYTVDTIQELRRNLVYLIYEYPINTTLEALRNARSACCQIMLNWGLEYDLRFVGVMSKASSGACSGSIHRASKSNVKPAIFPNAGSAM